MCAAELEKSLERNMPNHLVVYEWEGQEDKIIAEAKAKGETAGREAGRERGAGESGCACSVRQAGREKGAGVPSVCEAGRALD